MGGTPTTDKMVGYLCANDPLVKVGRMSFVKNTIDSRRGG
jgi:hypothetical protein